MLEQDTRRTRYILIGGIETTFRLPLPFCPRCAATARRRPKNLAHLLILLVLFFGAWFALLVLGATVFDVTFLDRLVVPLAAACAAATMGLVLLLVRPRAGQSSFFQPVRIPKLGREFVSGAVTQIAFAFTNRDYAKAFRTLNRDAVARKQVFVRLA